MFKLIINLVINLLASAVQLIMTPINALITATLPSISSQILQVTNGKPKP